MPEPIFQRVLFGIPPSVNTRANSSGRRLFRTHIDALLKRLPPVADRPTPEDRLYGRVVYFNHEKLNARDIHNILKPLFDCLEKYAYDDDKQILHFEGLRLDMEHSNRWFEATFDLSAVPDLKDALRCTCCLVEVGRLPMRPSEAVSVRWLQEELCDEA